MNEAQKSEWVQRYLEGELSGQELLDFEQHLAKDSELQTMLEEHKILAGGIRYHARTQVWDKIKALEALAEAEDTSKRLSGNSNKFLYWSVAAAVAVLLVSVVYFVNRNQPVDTGQLFAENFEPYPALAYAPQRSDTSFASMMEEAFGAYSNGDYTAAIPLFEEILAQNEETMVWFYLGNAYLAEGQSEQAIAAFQKFLQIKTALTYQGKWYLSLAYLSNDQLPDAEKYLKDISVSSSAYSNKASLLLKKIQ